MKNAYLIIADYSSEISYGVDERIYLCGIYSDEESANKRVEELKSKIEDVKANISIDDTALLSDSEYEFYMKAKEYIGFDVTPYESFRDDWDVDFIVIECPFGSIIDECLLGGANYAE